MYKVPCSFGELIDKYTILKIKKNKIQNYDKIKNIENEINLIEKEFSIVKKCDCLFEELFVINNNLWILEDEIRIKSKKKEFDKQYISLAESIHKSNDLRFQKKLKLILNIILI